MVRRLAIGSDVCKGPGSTPFAQDSQNGQFFRSAMWEPRPAVPYARAEEAGSSLRFGELSVASGRSSSIAGHRLHAPPQGSRRRRGGNCPAQSP